MNQLAQLYAEALPDEDPDVSYLDQEGFEDLKTLYEQGGFHFVGIRACALILVPHGKGLMRHTISSGGLWGIESLSDQAYLDEVAHEELAELKSQLAALNVDTSAFATLANPVDWR